MHAGAIAVLLLVETIGFSIAYMTSQTDTDEAIVVSNANKVISDLVESFFVLVDTIRGLVQSAVVFVMGNLANLAILSALVVLALLVHYESERVLMTLDRFIRRILYPSMKVGVWQTLHLLKFLYGTFAPIWNFYIVVMTQLTSGVTTIVAKCSARTLIDSVNLMAQSVIYFFQAIGSFLSGGVFESDFNVTDTVYSMQLAVVEQEKTVTCVCRQLSPFAEILLSSAKPVAFAQAINAFLNIFVTAVQEPVRIFTNSSFPDFDRTHTHIRDFLFYGADYADKVLEQSFLKFVAALQIRISLDFPEMFVFGITAHMITAGFRLFQWLQLILTNILLPRPSKFTNATYMVDLLSITPVFEEMDLAVEGMGDLVEWTLNTIVRGVEDVYRPLQNGVPQTSLPPLLTDADSRAASKVLKHALKTVLAVPHLALDATTTILWRSVLAQEQSLGDAFKQFDGNWYDANSCEDRVARGEECSCTRERDVYHPFCENPTLQADIFYNMEQLLDNIGHFGFQFMRPVSAAIRLPLQGVRIVLRGLFYFDEIASKEFFHYHINSKENPFQGEPRCKTVNRPGCEFNPTLPPQDAICLYSYPDDLITDNPDVLQQFFDSSDHWCNSLLIEFMLRELTKLTDILSEVLVATNPGCKPYEINDMKSDENILCAAAEAVRAVFRVPLNLYRQLNSQVVGFLDSTDLEFLPTHYETTNRFLETERALFAAIGTVAAPFPSPFDKTATRIGYSIASFPLVAVKGTYYATLFARDLLLSENIDWDKHVADCDTCIAKLRTIPDGAVGFVYVELRLVYVYVVELFESLKPLQEDFFQGFIEIFNIAMGALSEPLIEWIRLLMKVGTDLIKFFSTGRISGSEFLNDIVKIVKRTAELLARVSTKILGAILDMLGPLGSFLRTFLSAVCKSIYSVLCGISKIINIGDTFCKDDACLSKKVLKAKDHPFNHVPKDIAALGWEEDSRCDRIVLAYQDYLWGDLRPLEQIELRECAEQRYIAMELSAQLGVDLPVDMIYNWKRKFEMTFHGGLGALLYIRHLMGESSLHFKHQWDFWGVPDYWLDIFRMSQHQIQNFEFPTDAVIEAFRGDKGSASDVLFKLMKATNHTIVSAHSIMQTQPDFNWNFTFPEYKLGSAPERIRHTIDYAWDIQTDIDISGPTECALLDNTIKMFEMQTEMTAAYYRDIYVPVTVPHFLSYLEYDDPWVDDFERTMLGAVTNFNVNLPDFYDIQAPSVDGLSDAVKVGCQPESDDTLTYAAELFECFITGTGDEPLPYVQHNLEYMLKYQFRTCKYEQITCTDNISDRVDRMMEAFVACLWTTLGFIVLQYMTGFPIGIFMIGILGIYAMIFLTHVWNYTLFCYPNLPPCALDDIFAFTERYLIPKCMCEYFPSLADGCVVPNCLFISQTTPWQACEARLNELYGGEHFNIMWSPFMFAREYFPDLLRALHYFPPLYQSETFTIWMERVIQDTPITPLERDCIQFHYLNNAVVLAGSLAALFFGSTLVSALLKIILIPVKVIPSICTLIYSMLVSLDRQTMAVKVKVKQEIKPPPKRELPKIDYKTIRI